MVIANSIKRKNKIYQTFFEGKKHTQLKEIYEKQFKTYRNHLAMLLRITKTEFYETHFETN